MHACYTLQIGQVQKTFQLGASRPVWPITEKMRRDATWLDYAKIILRRRGCVVWQFAGPVGRELGCKNILPPSYVRFVVPCHRWLPDVFIITPIFALTAEAAYVSTRTTSRIFCASFTPQSRLPALMRGSSNARALTADSKISRPERSWCTPRIRGL